MTAPSQLDGDTHVPRSCLLVHVVSGGDILEMKTVTGSRFLFLIGDGLLLGGCATREKVSRPCTFDEGMVLESTATARYRAIPTDSTCTPKTSVPPGSTF